ncbi:MAG: SusC/RagA family TonB-linked outer membrane protein [Prevotella sp.]
MNQKLFPSALRLMALAMLMLVAITASAQNARVSMDFTNEPLPVALKKIESATNYKVLFSYDAVGKYTVSAKIVNKTAPEAVRQLVSGKPLQVTVKDKYITVSPANGTKATGKERHVTGVVLDDMGEPLLGASVSVPGSPFGTVTGADGRFELTLPSTIGDITVSYIGMNSQKVGIAGGRPLTVQLSADISMLNDVIVTGYQTISKERATGSFAKVTEKELESRRLDNITNVLEGRVAGYNDGKIRGLSTMYGEKSPLYVVDGFPVENQVMDEQGNVSTLAPDLNMDDIQDITVLKDAAAASIYGARAANGVIVITTKKGSKTERLNVGFSASLAWKPYGLYTGHLASSADMVSLEREWAQYNTNLQGAAAKSYAQIALAENYYPNAGINAILNYHAGNTTEAEMNATLDNLATMGYRYYDQVAEYAKRDELQQQYNLNIAKTTGKNSFKASVTYKNNAYEDIYSKDQSVGINLNNITKLTRWMDMEIGAYMLFGDEDRQTYNPLSSYSTGFDIMPYDRLVNDDGTYYTRPASQLYTSTKQETLTMYGLYSEDSCPMANLGKGVANTKTMSLRTYARLNIELTPWLRYTASFQYERGTNKYRQIQEKNSYAAHQTINSFASDPYGTGAATYNIPYGDILNSRDQYRKSYNFRQQLSFDYTINDLHTVTAIVGTETRENKVEQHSDTFYNYNDLTLNYGAVNEAELMSGLSNVFGSWASLSQSLSNFYETKNRYVSIYGNAAYTYDTRYSATFSMRWDRSNLWGTSNQYQNKPIWSAGLSWNASNEKFMDAVEWVDMLKVRATYGITGNVNPTYSPYMVTFTNTNYNIGEPYQYVSTRPNSDLSWEKTTTTNIGIDFSLLKNRLRGSVDYYNKYGERLLATTQGVPTEGYGYSSYAINNGEMRNRGFEMSLSGDVMRTRDLTWTLNAMLSLNKNKVTYVNVKAPVYFLALDYPDAYPTIGDQYGALYGYEWAGLDEEGMPLVYDENGEKTMYAPTSLDAIKCIGNSMPTYSGSFGTSVTWRDFDLSLLFTYQGNYKMRNTNMPFLNYGYTASWDYVTSLSGLGADIADRWQKPGDEATTNVPRACFIEAGMPLTSAYSTYFYSSANILDATHIKLSNISIAYRMPKDIVRKAYLTSARIQLNVENPFLWAKSDQAKYQLGGYNATTYVLGLYLNF